MKITIALPAYFNHPSGGYTVHYTYARLLADRGHDVTVIFPRSLESDADDLTARLKAPVWAFRARLKNRPLVPALVSAGRVRTRLIRSFSPSQLPDADLLIATSWHTAEALAAVAARYGRKYYIVYDYEFVMTSESTIRDRIEATYRMPFHIIATSTIVAEMVRRCGGKPIATIPCGLDFTEFGVDRPSDQREPLTVGFPLRPQSFKGADDAFAASVILRERLGETLRVTAFGAKRGALPDWIAWVDYPNQVELRRFYNQQAVFMVPSHFEGWGLPGVEALACGAALVTTDNGGCMDYARDGQTAIVVPPRNPPALADGVIRLLTDTTYRLRLAQAGHEFVQRFTWDDAVERLAQQLGA
ncbi:glycosyltransferase family 4 protein [Lichenicoccus sp.]|uniref:glycosyltransferase family 4 protein n=1 Tax=Lichenicoccus sp. TaxID=2781899 RepID=UPI003D12FBB4